MVWQVKPHSGNSLTWDRRQAQAAARDLTISCKLIPGIINREPRIKD